MWGDPDTATLYWKPIYKFIRFKFHKDNETAKDLTQGFFASALERDFFQRFDPAKAGFRTYLRLAVERFAIRQHEAENRQKRGVVGAIIGFLTQKTGTSAPVKRSS